MAGKTTDTGIPLQQAPHNNAHRWIVVMGSYTNPKGRFIEKVGMWIQRPAKTVQRSVVLNKQRIKYWLAVSFQLN